jgi:hypothetical protein
MSIARARLRAACVLAVFAAAVYDPDGTPARALDAPAEGTDTVVRVKAPAGSRKPAKVQAVKAAAHASPPKPGLPHPSGWPAAPIGDGPANRRNAPPSSRPPEQARAPEIDNHAPPGAETPPEVEEQNFFQRMIRARTRTIESEPDDPRRKELAEPPDGYRRQTPSEPDAVKRETNKSRGILGTLDALWSNVTQAGKTDESGPPPAPKPEPDTSESGGLLGKIGGMLPGFLRGSDKR